MSSLLTHYPALVISGPTAAGKSAVALEVAERCGGEIIGADAFQVYRGLPVLTAQPTTEDQARVPHHLVGEIPLTESFDVARYLARAQECLAGIHARGRIAVIVGGTGLYLRALRCGLAEGLPAADAALRAELEAQGLPAMQTRLCALDPLAATTIDLQNPRRVLRALEVCLLSGRPFSSFRGNWERADPPIVGTVLLRDRAELYARINRRVEAMLGEGAIEEVAHAGEIGPTARQTLGFAEIQALLAGRISRAECTAAIQQATRRYAKRQLTWFRREQGVHELSLSRAESSWAVVDQLVEMAAKLAG